MPDTSVFATFGRGVTPVTSSTTQGVTEWPKLKTTKDQRVNRSVTPVTPVTSEINECWGEEDWRAAFDERAAILEYDAGMSRPAAEAMARREIDEQRRQAA